MLKNKGTIIILLIITISFLSLCDLSAGGRKKSEMTRSGEVKGFDRSNMDTTGQPTGFALPVPAQPPSQHAAVAIHT